MGPVLSILLLGLVWSGFGLRACACASYHGLFYCTSTGIMGITSNEKLIHDMNTDISIHYSVTVNDYEKLQRLPQLSRL